jgi:sugar (pentulose or hexulose) kinase
MTENKTINRQAIVDGKTSLGIEFGSTRIKAVLINEAYEVIASGSYEWENRLENNIWTYSQLDIITGLQAAYRGMKQSVEEEFGVTIRNIGSIGFSAMMHGFVALDETGELLTPFRTWRNANTTVAADKLSELFQFNVPERWSIAHLYQAILDGDAYLNRIHKITTLAGYIHWLTTGNHILGIGDASGMFPIDDKTMQYDEKMLADFDNLIKEQNFSWTTKEVLPTINVAGDNAGTLTEVGAAILDNSGNLQPGAMICPPEGDAGTGMVATNAVAKRTGNISVGTSVFAMIVLDENLKGYYKAIDMVTTPTGAAVAMVHANNC